MPISPRMLTLRPSTPDAAFSMAGPVRVPIHEGRHGECRGQQQDQDRSECGEYAAQIVPLGVRANFLAQQPIRITVKLDYFAGIKDAIRIER